MANQKLISFDLKAEMGFLKKPDINNGLYLTYNILHKPALLGILGAIAGFKGYHKNGEIPEYYIKLKHLKIGITPLNSDKGNFTKDIVSYNNGTGFASLEAGGNLIIAEQILIKPSYRCYLLLDVDNEDENLLYRRLKTSCSEFIPYLGKNDFSAWWTEFKEYNFKEFDFLCDYKISSLFSKTEAVSKYVVKSMTIFNNDKEPKWFYFERLPIGFDEKLKQYEYSDFVYSNTKFSKNMNMSENGLFYMVDEKDIIQLY